MFQINRAKREEQVEQRLVSCVIAKSLFRIISTVRFVVRNSYE